MLPPPSTFLITSGLFFACRCGDLLKGALRFMFIPGCCIICKIMKLNSPSVLLFFHFSFFSFRQQKHFPLSQVKSLYFEFCQSCKMTALFEKQWQKCLLCPIYIISLHYVHCPAKMYLCIFKVH